MEPLNTSCEPMDVDLSINSTHTGTENVSPSKTLDCIDDEFPSITEFRPVIKPEVAEVLQFKRYTIKKKSDGNRNKTFYNWFYSLLALCVAVLIYNILDIKCIEQLNLDHIERELKNSVYGQTVAVNEIVNGLTVDVQSKLLFIYGGTGVGKTYSTSIILKNALNSSNVYHYTMPSFLDKFSIENLFGLNICETLTVVVDDLLPKDLNPTKELIKELYQKSVHLNKKVTVILVCNCDIIRKDFAKSCDDNFLSSSKTIFNELTIFKKFIKFEALTKASLKKCIQDQLGTMHVGENQFNIFLNNFNVSLDGCKGVHKKMKFLNSS